MNCGACGLIYPPIDSSGQWVWVYPPGEWRWVVTYPDTMYIWTEGGNVENKIDYKQNAIQDLKELFPHGHGDFIPLMVELMELHSKKNFAYAHGGKPLGNFDRRANIAEKYNICGEPGYLNLADPVVVAVWDMFKQIDAALWQLGQGYNDDIEGIRSRLRDVVVYGALAILMLDDREKV